MTRTATTSASNSSQMHSTSRVPASSIYSFLLTLPLFLSLLLCLVLTISVTTVVEATHWAYGTISWQRVSVSPARYTVNFEAAYRHDYPEFKPKTPDINTQFKVNGQLVVGTLDRIGVNSDNTCCRYLYDNTNKYQGCIDGGGYCEVWADTYDIYPTVTNVYPGNWMSTQTSLDITLPNTPAIRNAPANPPWTQPQPIAFLFNTCCRVENLIGLSDNTISVTLPSMIGLQHQYSPRSTAFPRISAYQDLPMDFVIPSVHPNGWPMTYTLSPSDPIGKEHYPRGSGLPYTYPIDTTTRGTPPLIGTQMSVDSGTGRVTWTPDELGLVAVQFTITSQQPNVPSAGTTTIVLDIIFEIIKQCAQTSTKCNHAPVFDPEIIPTLTIFRGQTSTYRAIVRSDDDNDCEILTSPLPSGSQFVLSYVVHGPNAAKNTASFTTYTFTWTPDASSQPITICFLGRDIETGLQTVGTHCMNIQIATGNVILVSGTLRDFSKGPNIDGKTYLDDFNHADGDYSNIYVSQTLGPNDTFPAYVGAGSKTTKASNYKWWFQTDPDEKINLPIVYDMIFTQVNGTKTFVWSSGPDWYPIDQTLFGNQGDAHNRYFTLEVHTAITYHGGEQLKFESSDDMFVYIDHKLIPSWTLSGIVSSQLKTQAVDMDKVLNPLKDKEQTFAIDIYYAHRSSSGSPQAKISIIAATLCNSVDSGISLINYPTGFTSQQIATFGSSRLTNNNRLQLMIQGPSQSSAAWFTNGASTTASTFKVSHGFEAKFNFNFSGPTEGFAFVIQFDNGAAMGGQSGQLGYGGLAGIKNSIAIEFDALQESALGDPAWNHVAVHSRFTGANDANELSRVSGSATSPSSILYNWGNGTLHSVRIVYIPAVDDHQGGPLLGWIRVYTGLTGLFEYAAPVTTAQVDGVVLEQMWHGAAYVGFTAATSDAQTSQANIYITDFKLTIVPPSPAKTYASSLPGQMAAGQTGTMTIHLQDSCGNPITTGGECPSLTATLQRNNVLLQTFVCGTTMIDNNDGSYTLKYNPTVASDKTSIPYLIYVTLTNPTQSAEAIKGSPFQFHVVPGQTDPLKSSFTLAYDRNTGSGNPYAGSAGLGSVGTVTITARDTYNNLQTSNTDPFATSFDPDISIGGGISTQPNLIGAGIYTNTFSTPVASTFQLNVRLNGVQLPNSPKTIIFVAGPASATQSTASGQGLVSSTVGPTAATFKLTLRDSASNGIIVQNPSDVTCLSTGDGCMLTPVSTPPAGYASGIQTGVPTPVNVPFTCAWVGSNAYLTCSYTTNVAYTYNIVVKINGQVMPSLSSTQILISPGAISAPQCIAQVPTTAQAGVSQSVLIQMRDSYSNNVPIPSQAVLTAAFQPSLQTAAQAPVYSSSGIYTMSFIPNLAGINAYKITIALSGTGIASSPYTLTVTHGTPDQKSTILASNPIKTPITAASTATSTFTIVSRDQFSNIRTSGGVGTDYLVTLENTASGLISDTIATIPATESNENYVVTWGTTIAGDYTLHAKVRTQSVDIVGGTVAVKVLPTVTSTPNCQVYGDGLSGGVIATNITFYVVAQDIFNNVQQLPVTDSFRAIITSGSPTQTLAMSRDGTGLYYLTYTVPPATSGHSYTIAVQRNEGSNTWKDLPGSPFTATSASASDSLYVTLEGSGATTGALGSTSTFTVVERDGQTGAVKPGGLFMSVDIVSAEGDANPLVRMSQITVSPVGTSERFNVAYTPQFTFPNGNPNFLITVRRGAVVSAAGIGGQSALITPSPYPLVLTPGPIYGSACSVTGLPVSIIAGGPVSFSVILRDAWNNRISADYSGQIKATLKATGQTDIVLTGAKTGTGSTISYVFSTSALTYAATWTAAITYQSQTLGSPLVIPQIIVSPSTPSATKSSIIPSPGTTLPQGSALTYIAGPAAAGNDQGSFTILVHDQYNNIITPSLLPNGKVITDYLSFALNDGNTAQPTTFGTPVYAGDGSLGAFIVSITAYRANPSPTGTYPLTATVSGTAITPSTPVHINSADISPSKSFVSGLTATVVAGVGVSFTFTAEDAYGNPWSGRVSAVLEGTPWSGTVTPSPTVTGLYSISFPGQSLTKVQPDPYLFDINANGVLLTLTVQPQTRVLPAAVDSSRTDVPPYLATAVAGTTVTIDLGLRDSYDNIIANPDQSTVKLIGITFPLNNGECSEPGQGSGDTPNFIDQSFSDVTVTSTSNGVRVSFLARLVGVYIVHTEINSTRLDCDHQNRLALRVVPGVGVASVSRVVGLDNVVAGRGINLYIDIFDMFGNIVSYGGANVQVGSPYSDSTPWSPLITSDTSLWIHNTSAVQDYKNGTYHIQVNPTLARDLQVIVTLDGLLIKTYSARSNNVTQTISYVLIDPIVHVSPNIPATYSVVTPDTILAARPFTLFLTVRDLYGNAIDVLNGLYNYGYTISGQSLTQTDYSFTGVLQFSSATGQYQWTATSALSGPVVFYISLIQQPNDFCIAQYPNVNRKYLCSDGTCKSSSDACGEAASGKGTTSTSVLPATCAAVNASLPYRCPDQDGSICKAAYAECPSLIGKLCPAATPVQCAVDSSCVASSDQCPCPKNQIKCQSGSCVTSDTECFPIPSCPGTLQPCLNSQGIPNGNCRVNNVTDCPSPSVCTPGYLACPDGLSCRRTLDECVSFQVPADSCAAGTYRCPSGRCMQRIEDCSAQVTCGGTSVVCLADGSCAASADKCQDQYGCFAPTPFQCADGSCRTDATGCPSKVTCPTGWSVCENGVCVQSASSCATVSPPTSTECPASQVRCASGVCVANKLLCPSDATCPVDRPVLCSDNSCVTSSSFCVTPRTCPTPSFACPDGSCTTDVARCPSMTTCPAATPILCADAVSCVDSVSSCPAQSICPITLPMRCPDGSCRGSIVDCPSHSACPATRPVMCSDGSCVYSSQQCADQPLCPAATAPLRCPGGECVTSLSLCPTHVTCPINSERCADGSCRTSCDGVLPINCASNQFSCPLASVGSLCVSDQSQCPVSFICPAATPVRCIDSSCASSVSACPALPATPPEISKVPCPDGSWTTDLTTCNTPASCPASAPYKCVDETCRISPTDCPAPTRCTNAATPYACPNGACAASPYASECRSVFGVPCDQSMPVKCPGEITCVVSINNCTISQPVTDPSNPSNPGSGTTPVYPATCPPQWSLCRDGSCRQSASTCPALTCPANLPYLCASGVCATKSESCPDPRYGCYAPLVGCATTGACVDPTIDGNCPDPPSSCSQQCGDGYCLTEDQASDLIVLCSNHQCALRCADGTCGLVGPSSNITASSPGNLCTLSGTPDTINTPLHNVCPPSVPYKCPNGLCTTSSVNCISLPDFGVCPSDRPVQCANAACVTDAAQCAPIYPCSSEQMRCGDGSCRVRQDVDIDSITCSAWGISNTCPTIDITVSEGGQDVPHTVPRYRCSNGMCGLTNEASSCIDPTSGCPGGLPTKCPNGACISASSRYSNSTDTPGLVIDNCAPYAAPSQPDGCPSPKTKCSYGGQCVLNTATDCPLPNGCLPLAQFRCTSAGKDSGECVANTNQCTAAPPGCFRCADGSCAANNTASNCPMLNGCPVTRPYRCANGDCAQFGSSALLQGATLSQVCPPTVTCPASQVMCYDGSCALTTGLCPSAVACEAPKILCADRTCVVSEDKCLTGVAGGSGGNNGTGGNSTNPGSSSGTTVLAGCPKRVPLLCDNGQCVSDISSCAVSGSPGSGTGTGQGGTILNLNGQINGGGAAVSGGGNSSAPNTGVAVLPLTGGICSGTPATPIECFDGTCAASYTACRTRSEQMHADAASGGSGGCPVKQVMCPTGECVLDPKGDQSGIAACKTIPACGVGKYRCQSGECVTDLTKCTAVTDCAPITLPGFQSVSSQRCQDGACRYRCPSYDGCAWLIPFQCSNRECSSDPDQCSGAAIGTGFVFSNVRPFLMPPLSPVSRRLFSSASLPYSLRSYINTDNNIAAASSSSAALTAVTTTTPRVLRASSKAGGDVDATAVATTGPCYSNCASQLKAWSYTLLLDTTANSKLVLTTDANHAEFASLSISAGALKINSSLSPSGTSVSATRASVTILPVADSLVRAAENRVPSSRTDVSESGFLTHVESVLSSMFELRVGDDVTVPFINGLVFKATLDMTYASTTKPLVYSDICLAKLFQLSDIGYSSWRCLYSCTKVSTDDGKIILDAVSKQPIPIRCPIHDSTESASTASGSITEPGIYAFVYTPVADPVPPSKLSWAQENAIWIFLVIAAALVFIFFVIFVANRLWRYRVKYHDERREVAKQLDEVRDMEQFGGHAGTKDEEVIYQSNPMVLQMKDMQQKLNANELKLREEEAKTKLENTQIRQEHITALKDDRDKMLLELEDLRVEIEKQRLENTLVGTTDRAVRDDHMSPASPSMSPQEARNSIIATGNTDTILDSEAAQVPQQARTTFAAVRTKSKKATAVDQ